MRVLVLTADTTLPRPRLRPTVTERIVATLSRGHVSYDFVHPVRLLRELAVGSPAPLLVVDALSVGAWLPEVFGELRRRVLGPSRPTVIAVGDPLLPVDAVRLFVSGVSNWLTPVQTPRLLDYWHWVCCQSDAELGGPDACRRISLLVEQCALRDGTFEMADRRLHARLKVREGRLSFPEIAEFDSDFTRAVRQFIDARPSLVGEDGSLGTERRRAALIDRGRWDAVLVLDALEQQLQSALRWFLGTSAQTRFVESEGSLPTAWPPSELLWRAEDLLGDGLLSRHRLVSGFSSHHPGSVANDTALADVS